MNKLLSLIFVCFVSCNSTKKPEIASNPEIKTNDIYYADINLYNIEGLTPLKEAAYPSVTIQDLVSRKTVTFHISKERSFSKEYLKKGNFWVSNFAYKTDTSSRIYTYEIVLKDKILTFNYSDTNSYIISDASLITNKTKTIYFPILEMKVEPKVENFDIIVKNSESKYIEEFIIKDSILRKSGKKIDKNNKVEFSHIACFPVNYKSIFWWIYFGHTQKNIDCGDR